MKQVRPAVPIEVARKPRTQLHSIARPRLEGRASAESAIRLRQPEIGVVRATQMKEVCPAVPIEITGHPRAGLQAIPRPRSEGRASAEAAIRLRQPEIPLVRATQMNEVYRADPMVLT